MTTQTAMCGLQPLRTAREKQCLSRAPSSKMGGEVSYVFSSKQGFQDLADRLARVVHAWASWEPEHTKSRQACGAPDGSKF